MNKRTKSPFLGEFLRAKCPNCGRIHEIEDPLSKHRYSGVRIYQGQCPHCSMPRVSVIGEDPASCQAALDDYISFLPPDLRSKVKTRWVNGR
jgi:hypothetical protein